MDETHDPARTSWVEGANERAPGAGEFGIQNLPYGVFRRAGTGDEPHIGVAIGKHVLDVRGCVAAKLLGGLTPACESTLAGRSLNGLMALGREQWRAARRAIGDVLDARASAGVQAAVKRHLVPVDVAEMMVPVEIGDYTDFYASVHHARNVGSMFRPDQPLMPNWKHLPVGYHGRASSIVVSGTPVKRPKGQTKADTEAMPTYGPCKLLDYEMEMGWFVGKGNALGEPLRMDALDDQIFGMVIVNDWSARDVQKWEYQPLGPFNAKNFATTISPWVVTMEALEPYRVPGMPRGAGDPEALEYLRPPMSSGARWGVEMTVEVWLRSAAMRERGMAEVMISRGKFEDMYWTIAQMTVHHTSTGCNLRPGDLLASGTISGPTEESRGCLLERTWRGEKPIALPDGTTRKFLQDGDEVIMRACCEGEGKARVGFGECRGIVVG